MRFTETPLEDWVFSPDYAVPLLENKLGVLSLEALVCRGVRLRLRRRGPFCITSLHQRGTLEHVDRIGFYDRQEYLVLDAVTVRNLELVEPLFANTSSEVTLSARSMPRLRRWANACCAHGCCGRPSRSMRSTGGWMRWKPA